MYKKSFLIFQCLLCYVFQQVQSVCVFLCMYFTLVFKLYSVAIQLSVSSSLRIKVRLTCFSVRTC